MHLLFRTPKCFSCQDLADIGEIENVRVVLRVRPLSQQETETGCRKITSVDSSCNSITVTNPQAPPEEPPKIFTFDTVFDTDSTQVSLDLSNIL